MSKDTFFEGHETWRGLWPGRPLVLIVLIAAIAPAVGCSPNGFSSPQSPHQMTREITVGNLVVTVIEQGSLESSDNTEILCKVRGKNTVTWVIESGTEVEKGDELLHLDTLFIEEQIAERSKYAFWSRSGAEHWRATVARAKLAIPEYLEGRYVAQLMTLEKDLAIAESNLRTAQNIFAHAKMMSDRGYVSALELEQKEFVVTQVQFDVEDKRTDIDVLKRFTKAEELEELNGKLNVATAQFDANDERADADASRRDRALEERDYCVVRAPKKGLVIHPRAAAWKGAPDITVGGTVHKEQVLLIMPDMKQMQVKVGVHESIISSIKTGKPANITLPGRKLKAKVSSVESIARPKIPGGGDIVKYDVTIALPLQEEGSKLARESNRKIELKPGMSAEVEIVIAEYKNVMMIPVAAVVQIEDRFFCWIETENGARKTLLKLGRNKDKKLGENKELIISNDVVILVEEGVKPGDKVVLNPLAYIEEAQEGALGTNDRKDKTESDSSKSDSQPTSPEPASTRPTPY